MPFDHIPVLLNETVSYFKEHKVTRFIDGTLGGAGHSSAILEALPEAQLLGIDRDVIALEAARQRLAPFGGRATAVHGQYDQMAQLAAEHGWDKVDGVLLDVGVSSPQIDSPQRGFSFRYDGPLDMRMDQGCGPTAADILNSYPGKELADIFYQYGEERKSRQVAKAVVARREKSPWQTTAEFAELLERVVGRANQHGLPPATRCFQALRIAVNDELGQLQRGLKAALSLLAPGGIVAVISFHSLEDRIVKTFFNYEAAACVCPPGLPVCRCGKIQTLRVLTRHPVQATESELSANPRSSCAKLRVAQKM